jgi:hypothetical protein
VVSNTTLTYRKARGLRRRTPSPDTLKISRYSPRKTAIGSIIGGRRKFVAGTEA